MNNLEIIRIMNKMIDNTKYIKMKRKITILKELDIIDKNTH